MMIDRAKVKVVTGGEDGNEPELEPVTIAGGLGGNVPESDRLMSCKKSGRNRTVFICRNRLSRRSIVKRQ